MLLNSDDTFVGGSWKILNFGFLKWHFLHFEGTFEQKYKGLKSHF